MSDQIIVRFPPSPTGSLHIGNVRTAIFNYLFAKQQGGKFFMRVEDTDKDRSDRQYELEMLDHMKWLGFQHDNEEIWHQSLRTDIYKKYLDQLIAEGKAYISHETEGANREVVRFKNPNIPIKFTDLVRGEVEFDTTELGDFIIAKNLEEPLYHLAVVIDDHESGITHVIRGEDHISNTPRQILIQEAIGAIRPIYAHLPLILDSDRAKLSKRKHGDKVSLTYYRNQGYLPEAIINYLTLLGWNPGTDQEIFTLKELIKEFDISKIQKGGAIFDEKKLEWVNKEHIKRLPPEVQKEMLLESIKNEPYIRNQPELDINLINWKETPKEDTKKHLETVKNLLGDSSAIMKYAEKEGKGNVLWPLRYALSGLLKSPDPFILLEALGKDEALRRIERALEILA
ncbi:MAG: glutamate--tRNA ligase family protein [bacterium]|nr:glutamate--tRNA ligase family protein [bacterium]